MCPSGNLWALTKTPLELSNVCANAARLYKYVVPYYFEQLRQSIYSWSSRVFKTEARDDVAAGAHQNHIDGLRLLYGEVVLPQGLLDFFPQHLRYPHNIEGHEGEGEAKTILEPKNPMHQNRQIHTYVSGTVWFTSFFGLRCPFTGGDKSPHMFLGTVWFTSVFGLCSVPPCLKPIKACPHTHQPVSPPYGNNPLHRWHRRRLCRETFWRDIGQRRASCCDTVLVVWVLLQEDVDNSHAVRSFTDHLGGGH